MRVGTRTIVTLAILSVTVAAVRADVPQMINYQGHLTDGTGPVDTTVAMTFSIYDDSTGGSSLWGETQPSVTVDSGAFSVLLGFSVPIHDTVFASGDCWLEIDVGGEILSPRVHLASVPYANRTSTVDGSSGGTITGDLVIEAAGGPLSRQGAAHFANGAGDLIVAGKATIGPNHTNSGTSGFVAGSANTTGPNADYGTVSGGFQNGVYGLAGSIGGGATNIVSGSYATVGGGRWNKVRGQYSVVAGGGSEADSNVVLGDYASILGGSGNVIDATGDHSYLFGIGSHLSADSTFMVDMPHIRFGDEASGYEFPTAAGSANQVLQTDGSGTLNWADPSGGGSRWSVADSVLYTADYWGLARGNAGNMLHGDSAFEMINLGVACTTGVSGQSYRGATVSGGLINVAGNKWATVGGGMANKARGKGSTVSGGGNQTAGDGNMADGDFSTVGGGSRNIAGGEGATVGGGVRNYARGEYSFIGGGGGTSGTDSNLALGPYSVVAGGARNVAGYVSVVCGGWSNNAGQYAVVGGGTNNAANEPYSVIGGGSDNNVGYLGNGDHSVISGGHRNQTGGWAAMIPGGEDCVANGPYSFAAGRRARVFPPAHSGTFVWADATNEDFSSGGPNQFLIRASGGVGIGTSYPQAELDVNGTVQMSGLKLTTGFTSGYVLTGASGGEAEWQPSGRWNWQDSSSHGPDSVLFADSTRYADSADGAGRATFSDSANAMTDGGIDLSDIGQNGAAVNQILKWNGSAWAPAADEVTGGGGDGGGWVDDGSIVRLETVNDLVGIGTATPAEKLEVVGGIKVGNTTGTNNGTIRYNGNDLEVYDSEWRSLLVPSQLQLPLEQSSSAFTYDGLLTLENYGDNGYAAQFEYTGSGVGAGALRVKNSSGVGTRAMWVTSDSADAAKFQVHSGTSPNTKAIEVANNAAGWGGYFTASGNRAALYAEAQGTGPAAELNGAVGIGTDNPLSPLDVVSEDNGRWNVGTGYGDFHVGDGTYGLSVGVTSTGGSAGDARIWTHGGSRSIKFGNATATEGDIVVIHGNGGMTVENDNFGGTAVEGHASNSGVTRNYGGSFTADGGRAIAVYGKAGGSAPGEKFGGWFDAEGDSGTAVFARHGDGYIRARLASVNVAVEGKAGFYGNYGQLGTSAEGVYAWGGAGYPGIRAGSVTGWAADFLGTTRTQVLEITGGSDLAEPFEMSCERDVPPGALVVIDENNPGRLTLSDRAYDTRVAGIVSGAGGIHPGVTLSQEGLHWDGQDVALAGRVYCLADASTHPVKPGDLLTTSSTPGHAMVATDRDRAYGSVIGKAMSALDTGQGLVLVLVSLQ